MIKPLWICTFALAALCHAAELPTAEAVFNKYVEVTGGKAAYDKVTSMSSRGSMEIMGQGLRGSLLIVFARPEKIDTVVEFAGLGKMRSGAADGVVWQTSAIQGPRLIQGEEREQLLRSAHFDSAINWKQTYGEVKVDGEEDVDGQACWRLISQTSKTAKPKTLWFGKTSGLLVKTSSIVSSPMGELPVESVYLEYRDFGGLKVAVKTVQKMGPQAIQTTLDDVKLNVEVPAGQFEIPAEIQALIKKP